MNVVLDRQYANTTRRNATQFRQALVKFGRTVVDDKNGPLARADQFRADRNGLRIRTVAKVGVNNDEWVQAVMTHAVVKQCLCEACLADSGEPC